MQPVIGNFYLALDNDSPFIYVVTEIFNDSKIDDTVSCHGITVIGGENFALSSQGEYVSAFINEREPVRDYLVKYNNQHMRMPDSDVRIFNQMNNFGANPVKRNHLHIQSKEELEAILSEKFSNENSKKHHRAIELFTSLNSFKKLTSPKLSL